MKGVDCGRQSSLYLKSSEANCLRDGHISFVPKCCWKANVMIEDIDGAERMFYSPFKSFDSCSD